jgi:hypothetical protein
MNYQTMLLKLAAVVLCLAHAAAAQVDDKWRAADAQTVRLSPSAFPQLPRAVARALARRGCTIPQAFHPPSPHNVISGEFARRGQTDWAVLCSRRRSSSILVFWRGSARSVSEIARAADISFLQGVGGDRIGFSRAIGAADRKKILACYAEFGGPKPPAINHHGIEDAYVDKASSVHYFHRGRWLELQGAD